MKNKFFTLLLSVVIAFSLWLYVITVESPGSSDTIYDIPLTIAGEMVLEERGLMITSDIEDIKVDLLLSGNRSDLIHVDASNITLKADLSGIDKPGVHTIEYDFIPPGSVASNAFVVESRYPEIITITVEKREFKEIPVQIEWLGAVPEGFIAETEDAVLDYEMITVSGPAAVVEKIDHAKIQLDLTDRKESIDQSLRFTLSDEQGEPVDAVQIRVNVEEVQVMLAVQRYKEVKLVVTLENGGGATSETVKCEVLPGTIKVAGSMAALEGLEEINLGTIRLADYEEAARLSFDIVLREGITNLSNVTEAEVDLQFPNMTVKEFTVTKIVAANVPKGMKADVITEKVTVKIRGSVAEMNRLTEQDITLIVDFTNAQAGTTTYRVQAEFGEGFQNVGLLGKTQVTATVTQS